MKRLNLTFMALALCVPVLGALAGDVMQKEPAQAAQDMIKESDRNKDGVISKQEANFMFRARGFRLADENKDKKLTQEELESYYTKLQAGEFGSKKAPKQN